MGQLHISILSNIISRQTYLVSPCHTEFPVSLSCLFLLHAVKCYHFTWSTHFIPTTTIERGFPYLFGAFPVILAKTTFLCLFVDPIFSTLRSTIQLHLRKWKICWWLLSLVTGIKRSKINISITETRLYNSVHEVV
jgi:hypothetical protein